MDRQRARNLNSRKAQSVIEYIVLMATVMAFLIIFLAPGGYFQERVNSVIDQQGKDLLNLALEIFH